MFKILLTAVSVIVCGYAAAADLSTVHQAFGLKTEPGEAQCLACHGGSYKALAEITKALTPNPHASHMADVQCDACHRWKGQSQLMCNDCHSFPALEKGLRR